MKTTNTALTANQYNALIALVFSGAIRRSEHHDFTIDSLLNRGIIEKREATRLGPARQWTTPESTFRGRTIAASTIEAHPQPAQWMQLTDHGRAVLNANLPHPIV